jgi:N-acetylneuraminate lyase
MPDQLSGLIAATYTPMLDDGSVNLGQIAPMVDHLRQNCVSGLYVCGSTGEGISLTGAERMAVAEAYVQESGEMPVVVQVGHNSLFEARDLARHAQEIGADAISANAPSYFKITDVETLVSSMQEIAAAAPDLPFYYYHIPHLTGAAIDMLDFLDAATDVIPNLAGIKYTAPTVPEYQQCLEWKEGKYEILWGADEMLLSALCVGARGAVGSTYNFAAPLYQRVIDAFDAGQLDVARELMSKAVVMVRTIYQYPFHSAAKAILKMQGVECGRCRLPQNGITPAQVDKLKTELEAIGFFTWSQAGT